ncbi:MAG TPA: SgcJ/EcaC family oxidoreductase [Gemmatimonadales bacterium]|nr:SgcJ/EcaC family oxidoreductase [Gemmatimonadales bacterium]
MRSARLLPALLLAFAATPLQSQVVPAPRTGEVAEIDRKVDAIYAAFRAAYARLDSRAVAALYREDALYLAANQPLKRGRAEIEAGFAAFFEGVRRDGGTLALEFRILRRDVGPGIATDVGYYRLAVVRNGTRGPASVGRFVTVARPDADGAWRFVVDAYSGADAAEYDAAPPRDP